MEFTRKQRLRKMISALAVSFITATLMVGVLSADTVMVALANLILTLSASGGVMMLASYNVTMVLLGVMALNMSFATFAGHAGNPFVTAAGAGALFVYTSAMGGFAVGAATLLCFAPALAIHMLFGKNATYTGMLQATAALDVALVGGSFGLTLYRSKAPFTADGIRSVVNGVVATLTDFYKEAAQTLSDRQLTVNASPGYTPEGAMATILNHLPALLIFGGMLAAYWTTTYYMKANSAVYIRAGELTGTYELSKAGAAVFVLAAIVSWAAKDLYSVFAYNLLLVQTLPCALVGYSALKHQLAGGMRGIAAGAALVMLLFTPVLAVIFFIATYGAFKVLFEDLQLRRGDNP
ncbi:MAG TPA: hypothetical protein VN446_08350 [Candidatus Acidoferrum sp.]|nr:hypothetical protein [Candidatus Acidoferrum sp.]